MNRFPETSKVQAMIDAAGVGNGANIKSGVSSGDPSSDTQVDFVTPFASIPNVIITPNLYMREVWIVLVSKDLFRWRNNHTGSPNIVQWIATTAGNS